jgi:membrane-associated HD superfamily phosphohydrolase
MNNNLNFALLRSYQMSLAKLLSFLGHPLLLGTGYVVLMSFKNLSNETAWKVSLLTVGFIPLPIIIHNLKKLRKGEYSNFDVSDQQQRKGFYPFAISLFILLMIIFYLFGFPWSVTVNTLNFLVMMLIMAFINLKTKASLHAGISFYISISLISLSLWIAMVFFILALGTSWSRLILGRHTLQELAIGMGMGLVFGLMSLFI